MVNSHEVETAAPSNPPLVPFSESSITSPKPLPVHSLSNGGAERPRIIKHKPSSITFADYDCAFGLSQGVHESSDCGESFSEEDSDDDDDDDVFTEITQIREIHPVCRHRRARRRKETGEGTVKESNGYGELESTVTFSSSTGYEAEEENSSREESPLVLLSPWSESMNQLIKKLDRLNLDIEEALSASSSPSDTPGTTRKQPISDKASHQNTTASGTQGNQTLDNKRIARGPSWKECHGQDIFLPNSSSVTRAHPRKTETQLKSQGPQNCHPEATDAKVRVWIEILKSESYAFLPCLYVGLSHPDKMHLKPFSTEKQKEDCERLESTMSQVGTLSTDILALVKGAVPRP
ncbi:hypothetical protein Baya_4869 [Bagarius yarrelli]|uniref:Uncharacterized protein n=1 Tax=Bagarius yarrelli TaxID=175774 RepID=A0A556TRS9_BAGYA|nr:hypothetical protein Baya_4869 [Bagarius yarrelli]